MVQGVWGGQWRVRRVTSCVWIWCWQRRQEASAPEELDGRPNCILKGVAHILTAVLLPKCCDCKGREFVQTAAAFSLHASPSTQAIVSTLNEVDASAKAHHFGSPGLALLLLEFEREDQYIANQLVGGTRLGDCYSHSWSRADQSQHLQQ